MVGSVQNWTGGRVRYIRIQYQVIGYNWAIIDSGSFFVDNPSLEAGQVSTFRFPTRNHEQASQANIVDITWESDTPVQ